MRGIKLPPRGQKKKRDRRGGGTLDAPALLSWPAWHVGGGLLRCACLGASAQQPYDVALSRTGDEKQGGVGRGPGELEPSRACVRVRRACIMQHDTNCRRGRAAPTFAGVHRSLRAVPEARGGSCGGPGQRASSVTGSGRLPRTPEKDIVCIAVAIRGLGGSQGWGFPDDGQRQLGDRPRSTRLPA